MAGYLLAIIAAAVFVSVICMIAPEGEGIGKYIGFAGALAVVLLALSPLSGGTEEWVNNAKELWELTENMSTVQSTEKNAEQLAYEVALTAAKIYDVSPSEITVAVSAAGNTDTFVAEEITVTLQGKSLVETKAASETLTQLFSCPVQVVINGEGEG